MPRAIEVPLCIDGRMLHNAGTGVSTYARILQRSQAGLARYSGTLAASPSRLPPSIGALGRHARRTKLEADGEQAYRLVAPDVFRRAHIHFGLNGTLLPVSPAIPFGIMHWTYPVPLYFQRWINIYAVHDVIPITRPDLSPISSDRLEKTLRAIAQVASAITTISEVSLREISSLDIFAPNRIINTSLAIEPPQSPTVDSTNSLIAAGLKHKDYLLFSGSVEHRKNVRGLIAAYRRAQVSMPLVVVGPTTADGHDIEVDIQATPGVIRLPYQTREALDELVAGAHALIFPSFAEGFGLPVIEAMAKGTAVLSSRIPAISEVAGDAALLANPTDIDELSCAIRCLATDPSLANALVSRGIERARLYSIEGFSKKVAAVYNAALSQQASNQTADGTA